MHKEYCEIDDALFRFYNNSLTDEDKALMRKKDKKASLDSKGLPLDLTTPDPSALSSSEDLIGYMSSIYMNADPLFHVPEIVEANYISQAVGDKIRKDTNTFGWRLKILEAIQNAVWYNDGAIEVKIQAKGVELKAISPYNLLTDTALSPERQREISYAGYIDSMPVADFYTEINSKQYLTSLGEELKKDVMKFYSVAASMAEATQNSHKYIKFDSSANYFGTSIDWSTYNSETGDFDLDSEQKKSALDILSKNYVPYTILYRRSSARLLGLDILDFDFVNDKDEVQVFKLTCIGGLPISVEPLQVLTNDIPMFRTATYVDCDTTVPYSFTSRLMPVQNYAEKMYRARLEAVRASLDENEVMDEDFVEKSGNKVYIKSHARSDTPIGLSNVYQKNRMDTTGLNSLLLSLQETESLAKAVSGNTLLLQGGHIPGNRTLAESQRLLSTSESRFRLRATTFHNLTIEPLQRYLVYAYGKIITTLEYFDKSADEYRSLTPAELRMLLRRVDLSDGMLPSADLVSPEIITAILTFVTQAPEAQKYYDLRDLLDALGKAGGFEAISKVRAPHDPTDKVETAAASPQADASLQQEEEATPPPPQEEVETPQGQVPLNLNLQQ
jgi:hypothetical protein